MQVAHLDAVVGQVLGESSSARRLVSVVTSTRSPAAMRFLDSDSRSSTWVLAGRTSTTGSTSPVGRTTCSTTCPWCFSS
jgi:hypothetical protein